MINNFDVVFYTLSFIVPGFVIHSVYTAFIKMEEENTQVTLIKFLYFSSINYAIWSWLIYLITNNEYFKNHNILVSFLWGFIIFISPVLIGLLAGKCSDEGIIRRILHTIGFNPIHVIPTAWDFKFSKTRKSRWVIITFIDGVTVAGKYGTSSFSSSSNNERDIYLEEVYNLTDDNKWEKVERTDGILICGTQIKCIELWK